MSIILGTKTYQLDSYANQNRAIYTSAEDSFTLRDTLTLSREQPGKRSGLYRPVAKSDSRMMRTVSFDEGAVLQPAVLGVTSSLPVGIPDADALALVADFRTWVNSPEFLALVQKQDINQ